MSSIKTKSGRSIELPNAEEDSQISAGIAADDTTPEWTAKDFARSKKASTMFNTATFNALAGIRKRGRPVGSAKVDSKIPTTIRLSPDVLSAFKATGQGWQTRMDGALRQFIAEHPLVNAS